MTRDELLERVEAIAVQWDVTQPQSHALADDVMHAVDAHVAANRERIAQAIEELPVYNGGYEITSGFKLGHQRAQNHAARIARAGS